ncbi:unnamed protein product, partial [Rotaria socialis]
NQNAKILTITTYNNIKIFKKLKSNRDLELKQELVKNTRSHLYECSHLFVVLLYNEHTDKLQTVRAHFAPSEFQAIQGIQAFPGNSKVFRENDGIQVIPNPRHHR